MKFVKLGATSQQPYQKDKDSNEGMVSRRPERILDRINSADER